MLDFAARARAERGDEPGSLDRYHGVQPFSSSIDNFAGFQNGKWLLGGVITAGDWTVKIPAGAFVGVGTITVRVPDVSVRKCELSIFPSLLNSFLVPVTLSCRLPNADAAGTYVMMWWDPATSTWKTIPSATSVTTLTCDAPLPHFSTYGCGKAGW